MNRAEHQQSMDVLAERVGIDVPNHQHGVTPTTAIRVQSTAVILQTGLFRFCARSLFFLSLSAFFASSLGLSLLPRSKFC